MLLAILFLSLFGLFGWLDTPDRSSSSSTRVVQDAWDVYRDELGVFPDEVVLALGDAVSRSCVDDFWSIWSRSAELGFTSGLFQSWRSHCKLAALPFLVEVCYGFVAGVWEAKMLADRVSQGGEVDVHCAQFFVNSSLVPVLLFRRRLKSVADVLKGIGVVGFLSSDALLGFLVCCVSLWSVWSYFFASSLGIIGFLLIFMVSTSGFLILLKLNGFLEQVVVSRRDVGVRKWTRWLREDLGSRPYVWLRPDFVPPSPFLVVKDPQIGCLFSEGGVILLLLWISSWTLLVISCLKSLLWIFPGLRDGTCGRWLGLKSLLLVCWMGGLGT